MNAFEQRLWTEVVNTHGARLGALPSRGVAKPSRPRTSPRLVTRVVIALVVVAAAMLLALPGASPPPPAYAVTSNRDGTVTLTIHELSDPAAVNRRLAQLGVPARVVPLQASCPSALSMDPRWLQPGTQPWSESPATRGSVDAWTVGIIPSRIPTGQTLVFALRQTGNGWQMADAIVVSPGPSCSSPEYLQGLSRDSGAPSSMIGSPRLGATTMNLLHETSTPAS